MSYSTEYDRPILGLQRQKVGTCTPGLTWFKHHCALLNPRWEALDDDSTVVVHAVHAQLLYITGHLFVTYTRLNGSLYSKSDYELHSPWRSCWKQARHCKFPSPNDRRWTSVEWRYSWEEITLLRRWNGLPLRPSAWGRWSMVGNEQILSPRKTFLLDGAYHTTD